MRIIFIKNILIIKILVISFFCSNIAFADIMERLRAVGGIGLKNYENIEILSQYISISADNITIDYVLKNNSGHDIKTIVTFPYPVIWASHETVEEQFKDMGLMPGVDKDRFLDFTTWVNGKKVSFQKHKETQLIAEDEDFDPSTPIIQITYYWEQNFPSDKLVTIRHTYKPIIGKAKQSIDDIVNFGLGVYQNNEREGTYDIYCADSSFKAGIKKRQMLHYNTANKIEIGYITETNKNWAGGMIKDFRLVIDKGTPDALITFCGENVKKISFTQFEMRNKNYKAKEYINILILKDWLK